ncbi:Alpha/Beta hydrolase protein [Lasiosphaeria ovina]|uniref:Carboxylic ester hydrolase n=1 Tax=Lasiosphaeria ovina TaxID=92902 RepID=A0AAE0KF94_9PEZI|nr:Alpha/Beta hydrolase protein [Lasiosphaeria ovina]
MRQTTHGGCIAPMSLLSLIPLFTVLASASASATQNQIPLSLTEQRRPPLVTLRNGTYEGVYSPTFDQDFFLGMPYAQDTSGANRFRVPQHVDEAWDGTRPATRYGHACPDMEPEEDALWGMSEDCLSINIVRPAGETPDCKLPVLFWIHGGSYQVGTSGLDRYNLSWIVQRSVDMGRPVLAASINYRKGAWGLLSSVELHGSGNTNLALRDMRLALAWVQENVAAFGGDPGCVTIWGESAGSFAVGQMLMSYGGRADGLFHRSIQQSGSAATAWYNGTEWYQPIYDNLVRRAGCADAPDTLACLRSVPYATLYPLLSSSSKPSFYPTVDGDVLPQFPTELLHAGRFAHIPHLYGSNSDEGTDNAPAGLDTDGDVEDFLATRSGFGFPRAAVRRIMELYPDDPAQGIPLGTGAERFAHRGWQYKRAAAILGDVFYHAPRLDDARHYAAHRPADTFVYRFNTRAWISALGPGKANPACEAVDGNDKNDTRRRMGKACGAIAPAHEGVAHATELAFVFRNPAWLGPWPQYRALSDRISAMWINFAHDGDPNGPGAGDSGDGVVWPPYASGGADGANLVLQTEQQGGLYVEPDTYRLAGREFLTQWARRRHV